MTTRWIAALTFLAIFSADAQTRRPVRKTAPQPQTTPAATKWPVASLSVEGNRNLETAKILAAAGLRIGQLAGKEEFEAARDRLLATGAFESVGYRFQPAASGKEYAATFEVQEIQQLFPYTFEGLNADEKALRAALMKSESLFGARVPGTQPVLDRMARIVEQQIGGGQNIIGKLESSAKGELTIVFRPATLPSIAEVKFTGTDVIDERTLQQAIASTAVGALFTEARFRELLQNAIRPVYEARGRVRVAFPKIETAPARNVKGLAVTVTVQEGDEYKLGDVKLQNGDPKLLKQGNFRSGDVFSINDFNEGVNRITQALRRAGYMRASLTPERSIDDNKKTVSYAIRVNPGPRFTMGKLDIRGLDIQTEPHIRKLWTMKAGSAFNADYPDYFLNRLREDNVLDNLGATKSEVKLDEANLIADVTLTFSGEKTAKTPLK